MRAKPILILSDAPDMQGGLSTICRHIAGQLSRSPRFRVGTLGRGAECSRHLPWAQYSIQQLRGEWGQGDLQKVWNDFAGRERGIIFTIWDATRCLWLSQPQMSGDEELARWLQEGHFDLWGYVTLDSTGPQDKLSAIATDALMGYRRLLAYTKWAKGVIERSLGQENAKARHLDWLPHGLDLAKWPLRDRDEVKARLFPFLHEGQKLIGAIGTNQPRKDWGLVASVCQQLSAQDREMRFWWHSDLADRHWSLPALLYDFGLQNVTSVSYGLSQEELGWRYAASDLTLHPGLGEGFGYPIFESLASGTPALHGDYAGGADVLRQCQWESMLVRPQAYRLEGVHNQVRPVFDPLEWARKASELLEAGFQGEEREAYRDSVAHLDWTNLWPSFQRWFEEGL